MGILMDYVGHGGDRNEVTFRILGVCLPGACQELLGGKS